jgi:hypothetical protein
MSCPTARRSHEVFQAIRLERTDDGDCAARFVRITGESHVRRDQHVTTMPSSTGGIVHVVLGFGAGTTMEKYDLVVIVHGSHLLVDDIYCTGTDPTDDVYAIGWVARSVCTAH